MQGYLKFGTFAQSQGQPVPGARIKVKTPDGRILEELTTDESGQTPYVALNAPPIEYSMEPDRPQPYSLYNAEIDAEGYGPIDIHGVQILPNEEAIQNVVLYPWYVAQPRVIEIPPNTLYGNFPEKIPESEVKPLPPATGLVVLPEVVIPEFIIVHDGVPSNRSAPNYWVPFTDYIKNVASSEIYATWPIETLRANILAICPMQSSCVPLCFITENRIEIYSGTTGIAALACVTTALLTEMYARNCRSAKSRVNAAAVRFRSSFARPIVPSL